MKKTTAATNWPWRRAKNFDGGAWGFFRCHCYKTAADCRARRPGAPFGSWERKAAACKRHAQWSCPTKACFVHRGAIHKCMSLRGAKRRGNPFPLAALPARRNGLPRLLRRLAMTVENDGLRELFVITRSGVTRVARVYIGGDSFEHQHISRVFGAVRSEHRPH